MVRRGCSRLLDIIWTNVNGRRTISGFSRAHLAHAAGLPTRPAYTIQNVIDELYKQFGAQKVWSPKDYDRSDLVSILPAAQEELPPRTLKVSQGEAIIPLGDNADLRDKYVNNMGGVRFGRILEDMDVFAVWVCHKYVFNPKKPVDAPSPFCLVTALVDEIDLSRHSLKADENIMFSGQVSWVGRTSLESTLRLYQSVDNVWNEILKARFVMVARDPLNRGAAFVNPIQLETAEEKIMYEEGQVSNRRRKQIADESLLKSPPTEEERALIHELFLKTIDSNAHSFSVRVKPENAEWMSDAKLKNVIICHPQERNRFNKIFGGFIMRQAFELGWTNAYVYWSLETPKFLLERNAYNKIFGGFLMRQASELAWALAFTYCKARPIILHVDDIWFRKPVEIGSLLYLSSQVVYTSGHHMQIRVNASVVVPTDPDSQETTNIFHFTFANTRNEAVKMVVPKSYSEAMLYLDGKRHYDEVVHSKKAPLTNLN